VALSRWITHGTRADVLWRTAMSGGRATVFKNHPEYRSGGDLTAVAQEGYAFCEEFYCEMKFLKSLNFHGLIKDCGKLVLIWRDTVKQAQHYGRSPLLIARENFT